MNTFARRAALIVASFVCVGVLCTTHGLDCMFYGFPELEYDGKDRVEPLTEKNFNKTVQVEEAKTVVFFSDVEADDHELDNYECFLQLSAQVMDKRGFKIFTVNTTKEQKLRKQEEVDRGEDTIHVYVNNGDVIEYFGVRDPDTFVSWLLNLPDEPVFIINDDDDIDAFEDDDETTTRIVGYFEPGSKELEEYSEAAEDFMGEVDFYAVVNSKWARKMGLGRVGDVHMHRPFEIEPLEAPEASDTEEEFEEWVEQHKDPVMQKLSLENYFHVWKDTTDEDEYMIVAFVEEETDDGEVMFDLLKKIAQRNAHHSQKLDIVLIDPDEFPLMIDIWEGMFGIEIENGPVIGHVDISEREGIWFDMDQLNLSDSDEHLGANIEVLQRWINQILNGSISLDDDDKKDDEEPEPAPKGSAAKQKPKGRKEL